MEKIEKYKMSTTRRNNTCTYSDRLSCLTYRLLAQQKMAACGVWFKAEEEQRLP